MPPPTGRLNLCARCPAKSSFAAVAIARIDTAVTAPRTIRSRGPSPTLTGPTQIRDASGLTHFPRQ